MTSLIVALLALINEMLAGAIVIVAASMLLYNLTRNQHDRVARTSALVLGCVTASYVCDVLVSLDPGANTYRAILRLQWIGIAFLPVAMIHLSDALLATTGLPSRGRRRRVIRLLYLLSAAFLLAAAFSDLLFRIMPSASAYLPGTYFSLMPGPLFPIYVLYFGIATAFAFWNVARARERCLTRDTRRRMGYLQFALLTPALGIFPFSLLMEPGQEYSLPGMVLVNLANLVVILLLAFLSYPLSFFGSRVPDRVVKTELLRFFMRGPMTGVLALVTITTMSPATRVLGIPSQSFLPFAVVAVVLLWQWFVSLALPILERRLVFVGEDRDQFTRLQTLTDRLLTREDYVQLMEATLASICEYLRVSTAFVVSLSDPEPEIIAALGPLRPAQATLRTEIDSLRDQLFHAEEAQLIIWGPFWAAPLNGRSASGEAAPIGILAVQARAASIDLDEDDQSELAQRIRRTEETLEDLAVQRQIFAALEGLLPQIQLSAGAREQIEFAPPRPAPAAARAAVPELAEDDEQFREQVRAALRHYWGGPGLTNSRLLDLELVRAAAAGDNPAHALRAVLLRAIEAQRPEGERRLLSPEWTLYNILEMRFIRGEKVKDVGLKLAMSEADLYRKQRVAIEAVADTLMEMERAQRES
jgi:hypothetical protein